MDFISPPPSSSSSSSLSSSSSSSSLSLLLRYGSSLLNKGRLNELQLKKALYVFQQCIASDPNDFRAYYNAALVYDAIANLDNNNDNLNKAIDSLNKAIDVISCNDSKDTDDNSKLSLMYGQRANYYIRLKCPQQAYDSCNEGLKYCSVCIVCISNINVCMRQLGFMKEAIALTWRLLNLQNEFVDNNVNRDIILTTDVSCKSKYNITVYCVKWGTKYNADYVNYLYRDLKKYISNDQTDKAVSWSMICFTEDDNEIRSEITCLPFPDDTKAWTGWWLKTSIFQNYHNHDDNDDTTINLNLYLDLDVCICGSLSFIIDLYDNNDNNNDNIFYTLGAEHLKSEGRPVGINSSFILWKNNDLNIKWCVLYDFLVLQYQTLVSGVYKFDHYLEMMLLGEINVGLAGIKVVYIQDIPNMKHKVIDYLSFIDPLHNYMIINDNCDNTFSVIIFPLNPKPHELIDNDDKRNDWIKRKWLGL